MSGKRHRGNLILGTVGKKKQQCAHKKGELKIFGLVPTLIVNINKWTLPP